MGKKYSSKVSSAYTYAKRDELSKTILFTVEEQGKFYIVIGTVRYAEFDSKQKAEEFRDKFNAAIEPVKAELSSYYNAIQESIITVGA
jgi:hypothetical protein